jgi:hypothetical protein
MKVVVIPIEEENVSKRYLCICILKWTNGDII